MQRSFAVFRQIFHEYSSSRIERCLVHSREQSPYQEITRHSTKVVRKAKLVTEATSRW